VTRITLQHRRLDCLGPSTRPFEGPKAAPSIAAGTRAPRTQQLGSGARRRAAGRSTPARSAGAHEDGLDEEQGGDGDRREEQVELGPGRGVDREHQDQVQRPSATWRGRC
jgi:hypothetical protein